MLAAMFTLVAAQGAAGSVRLSVPVPRPGNLSVLKTALSPRRSHNAINKLALAHGTRLDGAAVGGGHVSVYALHRRSVVWVVVVNRARGPFSSASVAANAMLKVDVVTAGPYSARTELLQPNVLDVDWRHAPQRVVPSHETPTTYCTSLGPGFAMLGGSGLTGYDATGVGRSACLLLTHTPFPDAVTFAGSFGATLPANFFPPA